MTATRAPSTTELAVRLRLGATRLARRLRQQSNVGLTPSQLSALSVVSRHGPLTLGALAEHERVSPPTVTKVVKALEAGDFVTRTADPGDRRRWRVATTVVGEQLLDETRRRRDAWLTVRLRDLDPDQRRRLADAIDVLEELAEGAE